MNVTPDYLFGLLGRQAVELDLLRQQLGAAERRIAELTPPAAAHPDPEAPAEEPTA